MWRRKRTLTCSSPIRGITSCRWMSWSASITTGARVAISISGQSLGGRSGRSSLGAGRKLSGKIRYRTIRRFFRQISKLYRARSLLYQRQIFQVNFRWKALDEIYKIYMLLHRSDLNISEKNRQTVPQFSATVCNINWTFTHFRKNHWIFLRVWWEFVGISQILIFSKKNIMLKNPEFF